MSLPSTLKRLAKAIGARDGHKIRHRLIDLRLDLTLRPRPVVAATVLDLVKPHPDPVPALVRPVDIILPVHNGRTHVERLFSTLFENTDRRHRTRNTCWRKP